MQTPAESALPVFPSLLVGLQEVKPDPCHWTKEQLPSEKAAKRREAQRIAVCSVGLPGHLRLAVAIANEMVSREYQVDFFVDSAGATTDLHALARVWQRFKLHIIAEGKCLTEGVDWKYVASSSGGYGGSKVALIEQVIKMQKDKDGHIEYYKEMVGALKRVKPDVVLMDHSLRIVQEWAEDSGIPSIVLHTPYYLSSPPSPGGCAHLDCWHRLRLSFIMKKKPFAVLEEAKQALGIGLQTDMSRIQEGASEARKAIGLSPHTFVFCEPELLNSSDLPPRVHAVGPCFTKADPDPGEDLRHWLDAAIANAQSVLYVAFGTLANGFLTVKAISTLLRSFKELGSRWKVLWSLPADLQPLLGQTGIDFDPDDVRIECFVRQRAVLAHRAVKVFLTHGGQSSVNEGIYAAVPLVCMPLFCDQYEAADAVERHGVGLVYPKEQLLSLWGCGGVHLAGLVHRVATEQHFRELAGRHAQLMRIRDGPGRAAVVIESVLFAGADYQELNKDQRKPSKHSYLGSFFPCLSMNSLRQLIYSRPKAERS
eukprot:TRINITY_DN13298_c0_g1_i1.p1 TRINITY_DN13298_c0_g1~~TRINITY_DN13298_c0_g1_i1.p1  ORF type:complete len:539 (+),score=104.65 TRINITY_DN13298_c0_g1_i1:129-1745(+)